MLQSGQSWLTGQSAALYCYAQLATRFQESWMVKPPEYEAQLALSTTRHDQLFSLLSPSLVALPLPCHRGEAGLHVVNPSLLCAPRIWIDTRISDGQQTQGVACNRRNRKCHGYTRCSSIDGLQPQVLASKSTGLSCPPLDQSKDSQCCHRRASLKTTARRTRFSLMAHDITTTGTRR